jgi:hypothetical protein
MSYDIFGGYEHTGGLLAEWLRRRSQEEAIASPVEPPMDDLEDPATPEEKRKRDILKAFNTAAKAYGGTKRTAATSTLPTAGRSTYLPVESATPMKDMPNASLLLWLASRQGRG